jgi:hypothetical protein
MISTATAIRIKPKRVLGFSLLVSFSAEAFDAEVAFDGASAGEASLARILVFFWLLFFNLLSLQMLSKTMPALLMTL